MADRKLKIDVQGLIQTVAIVCALLAIVWSAERRITVVEEQHKHMIQLLEKQDRIIEELTKRR